ncbi:MAG: class I SAM-dependent methyltransferase [Candidatus Korarchaeota archaeon]|nr:class I SAM-dependent methyltransferase [Candidatus Korarchaeota archaeon]NIU83118.1 methyltransferase domain-containing protein [Candidatus Thorarchaeota archaeon]NIW13495.1 methyltransferase domain-containing protein [Candidatus Thorarchaeota archaeon]NIW51592.1 methyltransferase domain-containing protein [Candidatus Korarchaeota archaeon]
MPQREKTRTEMWPQSLEWHVTWHWLEKYLPEDGVILDAGGGPGRYTIELAKRGYDVVLLDIDKKQLRRAREKIQERGVEEKVKIIHGSVTKLKDLESDTFDAVLCLGGVLTGLTSIDGEKRLTEKRERMKAIQQLKRVCQVEAPIFLGLCGLALVLSTWIGFFPDHIKDLPAFLDTHLLQPKGETEKYFFHGHYFTPKEAKDLVGKQGLHVENVVGLQGPAAPVLPLLEDIEDKEKKDIIREICVKTSDMPGMASISAHFLVICFKR